MYKRITRPERHAVSTITSDLSPAGLPSDPLDALMAKPIQARNLPDAFASPAHVRTAGWSLPDLWLPATVLYLDALRHNLDRFSAWCEDRGVSHAPHGKTTMAPQLWAAQLGRGAWGITAATAAQARIMRQYGVRRILIANEVVDPEQLRWMAQELADSHVDLYCCLDSDAGFAIMEEALREVQPPRPLPVLVELGVPGRRTGARSIEDALALAERVAASRWLRLAGVEGYEGALPQRRDEEAPAEARRWLDELTALAVACDKRNLFAELDEIVVTAGGSAYFDLVADAVAAMPSLSRPLRPIVRSGCYLTHDHLSYERTSPLRSGADPDPLQPSLVAYARVLSCPEPGRALLGCGKRDVAFDLDLPVPLRVHRGDTSTAADGRAEITKLNDQHAFCEHEPGLLNVGDIVELGLSHPCTVFDKWPLIPVVDSDGRVVDAIRTLF